MSDDVQPRGAGSVILAIVVVCLLAIVGQIFVPVRGPAVLVYLGFIIMAAVLAMPPRGNRRTAGWFLIVGAILATIVLYVLVEFLHDVAFQTALNVHGARGGKQLIAELRDGLTGLRPFVKGYAVASALLVIVGVRLLKRDVPVDDEVS